MTAARVWINGAAADQVSAFDRGLAYGDGLFESIRLVGTAAPLWTRHMQRLIGGCQRLQIPVPDVAQLWREALQAAHCMAEAVVRITLTRGVGERGYALPMAPRPVRIVAAFDPPQVAATAYTHGVRTRLCAIRMAAQPLLAGLKHLNRLEQVLARAEWRDPAISEGIMCDSQNRVISATMANLFARIDEQWVTPSLDHCGVAGVARAEVLSACPNVMVGELTLDALRDADEIFLSSSVRGIVPVCALDDRLYEPGMTTRALQRHWRELGFLMEQVDE